MRYFLLILGLITSIAHATSQISMTSDNGDWIGGGRNYTLLSSDISSVQITESRINISTNVFSFNFSLPNDRKISTGAYLKAERDPFRGPLNPGIDISGQGRGCNTISGEFYIYEVDAEKSKLAMDFVQRCEGGSSALKGSIRINSDIPIPFDGILVVTTSSAKNALEESTISISAKNSISNPTIQTYKWEQTKGKTAIIQDTNASETSVTLPTDVDLGGEDVELKLTITNTANVSSSSSLVIHVASKSDPQTYLKFSGQYGDYISQGGSYYYDKDNSTFQIDISPWSNAVNINIQSSSWWSINFSAPGSVPLTIQKYAYAERYPFQSTTAAGLTLSGDGRGCNQSFGSFEVKQISMTDPMQFKALFEQHCEQMGAPTLKGEVAFNAVSDSVPKVEIAATPDAQEGSIINLDASSSSDPKGSALSFNWTTDEPGVVIQNKNTSRPNFIATPLANRVASKPMSLKVIVKNAEGFKAQQTMTLNVIMNNKAPVAKDDTFTVKPGAKVTLHPLTNDTDSDGSLQTDTINIKAQPLYGEIIVNSDGSLNYSQNKGTSTTDSFQYTIKDNDAAESALATVNLVIKDEPPQSNGSGTQTGGGGKSGGGSGDLLLLLLLTLFFVQGRRSRSPN